MVLDLSGRELQPGLVVRFWCSAIDGPAVGYVEAREVAPAEPGRVPLRATSPDSVRGMCYEAWAADCEVQTGPHGRPLEFVGKPADLVTMTGRGEAGQTLMRERGEGHDQEAEQPGAASGGPGGGAPGRAGGTTGGGPGGVAEREPGPGAGPDAAGDDPAAGAQR